MCPVRVQPFYSAFSESNVSISNEIIKKHLVTKIIVKSGETTVWRRISLVGRNIFVSLKVIEHFCSAD